MVYYFGEVCNVFCVSYFANFCHVICFWGGDVNCLWFVYWVAKVGYFFCFFIFFVCFVCFFCFAGCCWVLLGVLLLFCCIMLAFLGFLGVVVWCVCYNYVASSSFFFDC